MEKVLSVITWLKILLTVVFVIGQHFSVMSMVMKQCPAHRAVFLCSNANDGLCGGGRDAAWFVVCSMFPQKQIA